MNIISLRLLWALALVVVATPVEAADKPDISGSATIASEGIGRGFSITNHKVFYALGVQVRAGGLYVSAATDRFEIAGASNETYVIAGYTHRLGRLTVDTSVVRYFYDSKAAADFWEGAIVARHPIGPATLELAARGSVDYFANAGHALYTYANLSSPVWEHGQFGVAVSARVGQQKIEKNAALGAPDWFYWNAGVSLRHGPAVIDLTYHDTNIPTSLGLQAGPRLVGSLSIGF